MENFFLYLSFFDIDEDTKRKLENKNKADLIFQDKKVGIIYIEDNLQTEKIQIL